MEQKQDKIKVAFLNDKFEQMDESKLIKSDIMNLSAELHPSNKAKYENFDLKQYTSDIVKDVTNNLCKESIDELKTDMLISMEDHDKSDVSKFTDTKELKGLLKKYEDSISEVDAYFNALQTSVRKAEAEFKGKIVPTSYQDDKINVTSTNMIETMGANNVLQAVIKMIGSQSGVVRNVIYLKVAAIDKVIQNRISLS